MRKTGNKDLIIYQSSAGALELKADAGKETIWATLNQIADLFETDKSGISRHINNILKTGELTGSTVAKYATVQSEGARVVSRNIEYYNLDMILSVGYRVNSKKTTTFRQWATKTLRDHILNGYTIKILLSYKKFPLDRLGGGCVN
ncbi:MAG: RhuM family protein [bacterium]